MPSWETHKNILDAILKDFIYRLPKDFVKGLYEGVVDPDRVPDKTEKVRLTKRGRMVFREVYVSHHNPPQNLINYYYNLSLYNLRRGDRYGAGFMLGRALHYIQDSSVGRRKYLILDVHNNVELLMNRLSKDPRTIEILCSGVKLEKKKKSSSPDEALCIAFRETKKVFEKFVEEALKNVDIDKLKKNVRRIKMAKVLIPLLLYLLVLVNVMFIIPAFTAMIIAVLYIPKTYYEAMKAGLMIVKPFGIKPVY